MYYVLDAKGKKIPVSSFEERRADLKSEDPDNPGVLLRSRQKETVDKGLDGQRKLEGQHKLELQREFVREARVRVLLSKLQTGNPSECLVVAKPIPIRPWQFKEGENRMQTEFHNSSPERNR